MKVRDRFPGIPSLDVFMNLVVLFLCTTSILIIALRAESEAAKDDHVQTDAPFMIRTRWPGMLNNDVDPYVRDPIGNIVFYKQRVIGGMSLSKDVLGADTVQMPDGRNVSSEFGQEDILLLGPVPALGEYVVNVNLYRMVNGSPPTNVEVTLYKITEHHDIEIVKKVITLAEAGQEETAFRFTLTNDRGVFDVVDVNNLPIKLIRSKGKE